MPYRTDSTVPVRRPMYKSYFNFSEDPFTISPNPRFLYLSERHREALAHLQYGVRENSGFILLTGEIGTGKTTVWRCLASRMPDDVRLAVVLNPRLSESELVESICDEFGIAYEPGRGLKHLVDALNRHLLALHERGERAVLIVEEAQNLDTMLLEQLRLLTNLETDESKLLQIILVGQPELLDKIDGPQLRQLRQRVTARYHLTSLDADEVRAYVAHRLEVVGGGLGLFTEQALLRLTRVSAGIPRLINLICSRALLGCFSEDKRQVDLRVIEQAACEVLGERPEQALAASPVSSPAPFAVTPRRGFAVAAGVALLAAGIWLYGGAPSVPGDSRPLVQGDGPQAAAEVAQAPAEESAGVVAAAPPVSQAPQAPPLGHTLWIQRPGSAKAPAAGPAATPAILPGTPPRTAPAADWRDGVAPSMSGERASGERASGEVPDSAPYRTLFALWGVELPRELTESPCEYALRHGLDCWHRRGSFDSVERVNRPALLKMVARRDGRPFYAVLNGVGDDGSLQMNVAGDAVVVARRELDEVWTGEYTLLWRRPSGYRDTIYPGDKNDTVRWVAQGLSELTNNPSLARHSSVYSLALENQVRGFQYHCGLFVDGLVGKETLIRLSALVRKEPLLRDDVLSCRSRLG